MIAQIGLGVDSTALLWLSAVVALWIATVVFAVFGLQAWLLKASPKYFFAIAGASLLLSFGVLVAARYLR